MISKYDYRKHLYFQKIGGTGFAIGKVHILEQNSYFLIKDYIKIIRYNIANRILEQVNISSGSIIIALLVGIKDFIPRDINDNIKNAGLAHLLAISGLHLGFAVGIFFLIFRFFLKRSEYLALNHDVKKISAMIAIFFGFLYLVLSGLSVSAVRSFIMVAMAFLAITLDKKIDSLRSLSITAFIILILRPDFILSIGFQLSFTAVLTLILLHNKVKNKEFFLKKRSLFGKLLLYFLGIIISSIAVGITITPFLIYYFNQYIQYSILSNLMAIPLISFIIMPLGFLSLFLMLLNLDSLTLPLLSYFVDLLLKIANFNSSLPYSHISVKSISTNSFLFMILGGLIFSLINNKIRYIGLLLVIFAIYFAYNTPIADIFINREKKLFAIYDKERGLFFSKKNKNNYIVNKWLRFTGESKFQTITDYQDNINHDSYYRFNLKKLDILILTKRNKINFLCEQESDILINLTKYLLPNCIKNNIVIDNYNLTKNNNLIFLDKLKNK